MRKDMATGSGGLGLAGRLWLVASILLVLPWLGYQYLENLKRFLLDGQIEAQQMAASAIATALHDRPALFDPSQTSFQHLPGERDLYVHPLDRPVQVDGRALDWQAMDIPAIRYGTEYLLWARDQAPPEDFEFTLRLGERGRWLYGFVTVRDPEVVLRDLRYRRLDLSDQIRLEFADPAGAVRRIVLLPHATGAVSAYDMRPDWRAPVTGRHLARLRAVWRARPDGYQLEFRLPKPWLGPTRQLRLAVADARAGSPPEIGHILATLPRQYADRLNRIILRSPELQRIIDGLQRSPAAICIVDRYLRVRAVNSGYPANGHICRTTDARSLQLVHAALAGRPGVIEIPVGSGPERLITAAHPILGEDEVLGAVLFERSTADILQAQKQTFLKVAGITALVMLALIALLLLFSARLTARVRRLHRELLAAIDENGRVLRDHLDTERRGRDDLAHLAQGISMLLGRLKRYTGFLETIPRTLRHEILNPVNTISMTLQRMRRDELRSPNDPCRRSLLDGAWNATRQLQHIVNGLTEAAHIEEALRDEEMESFDLAEMLQEYVENARRLHPGHRFEITTPERPLPLRGNALRIAQLLDKIKDNALDFASPGTPIRFALQRHGNQAEVRIENEGPPIPPGVLESLFTGMTSHRPGSSGKPHLGIGLYIAHRIVQHHGGSIRIENRDAPGGVRVTLHLPLSLAQPRLGSSLEKVAER